MAAVRLFLLLMFVIFQSSMGSSYHLDVAVNCGSLMTNRPIIRIKSDVSLKAFAKCKGGYKQFAASGDGKMFSLVGYFSGSKMGCRWKEILYRNKPIYTVKLYIMSMARGVKFEHQDRMKTLACTFGALGKTGHPIITVYKSSITPKMKKKLVGKIVPHGNIVDVKVKGSVQTNKKYTYKNKNLKVVGSCGRSPMVRNSMYGAGKPTKMYEVIRYRCKKGYRFYMGRSTIKCLRNGRFTKRPKCVKTYRSCGRTPQVTNSVSGSGKKSKIFQTTRYRCKYGYRFYMRRSTIYCRSNGRFTIKPRCIKASRSCGRTPYVYGSISGSRKPSMLYQVIRYKCKSGYRFYMGRSTITCLRNGKFSARPRCIKVSSRYCGRTPVVKNAVYGSKKLIKVNQVVRYYCRMGYKFSGGRRTIKCLKKGKFTKIPRCVPMGRSCGKSPFVYNSIYGSGLPTKLYQVIQYRCKAGYRFYKERSKIKCQFNRLFTIRPWCIKVYTTCGRTPKVMYSISGSRKPTKINQAVRYKCRKGYRFYMGISTIKCKRNGRFTRRPRCRKAKRSCGRTPTVYNSASGSRRTARLNQVIKYQCRSGYRFYMGRSTIKCLANGMFSTKPRCVKVSSSCGKTPYVYNSMSGSRRSAWSNQVIRYRCRRGYIFYKGRSTIKCQPNGKFTLKPYCMKARSCGRAPDVINSSWRSSNRAVANTMIVYSCKAGFIPYLGRSSVMCLTNGKYTTPPLCIDARWMV